ncbi:MAG: hypothetical protein ACE5IZ_10375 [Dehalococcoidia bacterium]
MAYTVTLKKNPSPPIVVKVDGQGNIVSMDQPVGYTIGGFNELASLAHRIAAILLLEGMDSIEIERE